MVRQHVGRAADSSLPVQNDHTLHGIAPFSLGTGNTAYTMEQCRVAAPQQSCIACQAGQPVS